MKGRITGEFFMGRNFVLHSSASTADKEIGSVVYVRAVGSVRAVAV